MSTSTSRTYGHSIVAFDPPPCLPNVEEAFRPKLGSSGASNQDLVRELYLAYRDACEGDVSPSLHKKLVSGEWRSLFLTIGTILRDENISLGAFVRFVFEKQEERLGKRPWPQQVFSIVHLDTWMRRYRIEGGYLDLPRYTATPERTAAHRQRIEDARCRCLALLQAEPGSGVGDLDAHDRGPDRPPPGRAAPPR